MTEPRDLTAQIQAALEDVDDLRPAEEIAVFEHVLTQLTEHLNAPDDPGVGVK